MLHIVERLTKAFVSFFLCSFCSVYRLQLSSPQSLYPEDIELWKENNKKIKKQTSYHDLCFRLWLTLTTRFKCFEDCLKVMFSSALFTFHNSRPPLPPPPPLQGGRWKDVIYLWQSKGEKALHACFTSFAQVNTETGYTLDNTEENKTGQQWTYGSNSSLAPLCQCTEDASKAWFKRRKTTGEKKNVVTNITHTPQEKRGERDCASLWCSVRLPCWTRPRCKINKKSKTPTRDNKLYIFIFFFYV